MDKEEALIEVKKAVTEQMSQEKAGIVTEVLAKFNKGELVSKEEYAKANDTLKEYQKGVDSKLGILQDKFEGEILNAKNVYGSKESAVKSQAEIINDFLQKAQKGDLLDTLKATEGKNFEVPLTKASQLMPSLASGVLRPERTRNDVVHAPESPFRIVDLVNRGASTLSSQIDYVRETSFASGVGLVNEAGVPGQSNFELAPVTDQMRKIMDSMDISSELIMNLPYLLSYVIPRLESKYATFLGDQILKGTNAGNPAQIRGLWAEAQTFVYNINTVGNKVVKANLIDLIFKGKLLATNKYHVPNVALVHPTDMSNALLEKTTTGEYTFKDNFLVSGRQSIEIIETPLVTRNEMILGAFNTAAELFTQKAPVIEFSGEHLFKTDMVVLRMKSHVAQQITQPEAFVKFTDVAANITAITAP